MKNLKNILSAFAFVLAIGAVLAFTPTKSSSLLMQDVQGAHNDCPSGQVDASCSINNDGDVCTFVAIPQGQVDAIPEGTTSGCLNAQRLKFPK